MCYAVMINYQINIGITLSHGAMEHLVESCQGKMAPARPASFSSSFTLNQFLLCICEQSNSLKKNISFKNSSQG